MSRSCLAKILVAALLCGCQSATAQSNDPPGRVGRVSSVSGSVSLMLAGDTEWRNASLNYPLTTADALWADAGARAEIHVGASAIHLDEGTSLALDAIEDNFIQLRLGQGSVHVRLRAMSQDDGYEIDTPAGAILLRDVGNYRIDVTPDGQRTTVTVRNGDADVMIGNNTYRVQPGTSVVLTSAQSRPIGSYQAIPTDSWEQWAEMRNRRGDDAASTRYVPREMVGYEDLDQYGDWQVDASYGPTWYPRSMSADWAPYRTGRWESVEPWGWTWIDDAPWGFAPYHYGRWSHRGGRWGWMPGHMAARPVYAPALVAFVSGSNWNVSLSFGSNGGVGWVPLGPQEVYLPSYRASPTYIRNVNITSVNVTNINVTNINVNNVRYINRDIPGAVTAVPRDVFMGSRPVRQAAVRVRPTDLTSAHVSVAPIADNAPVAPPRRGSAMDRARPDNVGTIRQPPVELKRSPSPPAAGRDRTAPRPQATPIPVSPTQPPVQDRGRKQPDQQQQPPVTPPTQDPRRGRGRGGQQPPVNPPAAIPTPPPVQDRGRKQPDQQQQPPVTPPTQDPRRGRGGQQPPVNPPAAIPTPPPTQGKGRKQADPQPPAPVKQAPPTAPVVIPTPPPTQDRGRKQPSQPTPPAPKPDVPPPSAPVTPRGGGRAMPTHPTAPVGRGRTTPPDTGRGGKPAKPTKTKPDTGRGGGSPSLQLEYQL